MSIYIPTLIYFGVIRRLTYFSATGGATLKAPVDGWSSEDLEVIFSNTVPRDPNGLENKIPNTPTSKPTTPRPTSGPTSGPTSSPEPIQSSLSKGAVVGVVIGSTLTAIILIWALVRLKKTHALIPEKLVETVKVLVMQDDQWHKPELDASSNARHELDISEPRPRELHEEGVTRYELPGSYPSLFELP